MTANAPVARIWRAKVRAGLGDEYETYLTAKGILPMSQTTGNMDVRLLRRDEEHNSHFLVLSIWTSKEAMLAWSGSEEQPRHLERDRYYLIELPMAVEVFCLRNVSVENRDLD